MRWAPPAAALWSLLTMILGLFWTFGGPGFPFGENDPRAGETGSLFAGADAATLGPAIAVAGVAGTVAAVLIARGRRAGWLSGTSWLIGAVLLLAVPDVRVLQNFAYLFFGHTGLWDAALAAQLWSMAGGALFAITAVAARRRRASGGPARRLVRHRRGITYLAAALALPYPVVRIGWALGIPVGVPASYLADASVQLRVGESLLGALAIGGAVLTVGLVRSWGTVFPRWVPVVRGRPVPVWLAVLPGAWAALLIVQAGLRVIGWTLTDGSLTAQTWGMGGPGLFWLPWGLAVGAATYAYAAHRREYLVAGDDRVPDPAAAGAPVHPRGRAGGVRHVG